MNQKFSTEFVVSEPVTATIVNHGFDPTIPSEIDIHIKCKDANSSFTERSYGWSVPKGTSVCCEYSIELPVGNYILSGTFKRRDNKPGIIGTTVTIYGPPTVKDYQEVISKYQDTSGNSIGGGLRIKSINNYDSDGTLFGRTEYEYEKGILQIPTVRKETIYLEDSYSLSGSPNSANMYSTLYNCILVVNSNPP